MPAAAPLPWKLIIALSALLLAAFFLHMIVFSDLEAILSISNRNEFLKLLYFRAAKLVLLLGSALAILVLANKLVRNQVLSWMLNALLWILVLFYAGELWLSVSPISQGNLDAYVGRIWYKKYWSWNKFGFRDREYNFFTIKDDPILFDLGDSYVAGFGIKNVEERSSNLLEKGLDSSYYVINAGTNGSGTRQQLTLMRQFPLKPRIVLWTHVINDIEELIPQDMSYQNMYRGSESALSVFLHTYSRNSVFLDLVYHFFKAFQYASVVESNEGTASAQKPKMLYEWYRDTAVLGQHLNDLDMGASYITDTLGAKLVFMLYPEDGNKVVDTTDLYVNQVIRRHFEGRTGVYFLNVTPVYKAMRESARRVNMFDGHPSERVNRILADSLVRIVRRIEKE